MPQKQGYAAPGAFGPWVDLYSSVGEYTYDVSWETISNVPSNYEVEIRYATNSGYETYSSTGDGSYTISGNDGAGSDQIRFRSFGQGQNIRIIYQ